MSALSIKNLTKVYNSGHVALQGIDLNVQAGDFFALLGPNGAGKSTTIGIVCSLINKTSGSVNVFDFDIDSHSIEAKSCIGVVPQEFNFNVFEPVIEIVRNQAGYYGLSYKETKHKVEHYLRQLGLWEKRHSQARDLSGGMKRRLMIARALIHEPKLLILDEPTAGVDIELRRSMWDFIRHINEQGTTIILTTHYLEEAENLCRNIAIIDEGIIVEDTSIRDLLYRLKMETFILYTRNALHSTPVCDGYQIRKIDENTLEVDVFKDQNINNLFVSLTKKNIDIVSMRAKTNRLEQLFFHLLVESSTH